MASEQKIAKRYAKAVFDYVKDPKAGEKTAEELQRFGELIDAHESLRPILFHGVVSEKKRGALVEELSEKLGFSELSKRIIRLMSNNRRLEAVKSVGVALHHLLLDAASVMPLRVESAKALKDSQKRKLEQTFESLLGKRVEAKFEEVPHLVGGLKVTAGGRTFDGSIRTQLAAFAEQLMEG